jgi:hypothetical protein
MTLRLSSAVGLLVLSVISSACEEMTDPLVAPERARFVNQGEFVGVQQGVFLGAHPVLVSPVFVTGSTCPSFGLPPFTVPFALTVGPAALPLTINEVGMEFVDTMGVRSVPRTLGQADLVGPVTIPSFSSRMLDLTFLSACNIHPAGVLTVAVTTSDNTGNRRTSSTQLRVQ